MNTEYMETYFPVKVFSYNFSRVVIILQHSHIVFLTKRILPISTSVSRLAARSGCMRLGACFTRRLPGSISRCCIATVGWGFAFRNVHVNSSRFCLQNSMYVSFLPGTCPLMKVGYGSASEPKLTSYNSSKVACPPSSNSRHALPGTIDSLSSSHKSPSFSFWGS